jgi:hypothetical protein
MFDYFHGTRKTAKQSAKPTIRFYCLQKIKRSWRRSRRKCRDLLVRFWSFGGARRGSV